jgi:hypothetical protein
MADLIAWRTDEKVPADLDRQPRRWLTVGSGKLVNGAAITRTCLFVLEDQQAQDVLGLDLAQFSTEPVRVALRLEVLT